LSVYNCMLKRAHYSLYAPLGDVYLLSDWCDCVKDLFFYSLVYDNQQKSLIADHGEIRVGLRYQVEVIPDKLESRMYFHYFTPGHLYRNC